VSGVPILFAGASFIHGNLQEEDDRSPYIEEYRLFGTFFEEV